MALTTVAVAAGGIDKTIANAVMAFVQTNVMLPLVNVQRLPLGSNIAQWSDETRITSSSVDAKTEGSDQSTIVSMTSATRTATLSHHVIRADIGDLAKRGSALDLVGMTGVKEGAAVGGKLDSDLIALIQSFSQTLAGAGTALALSHLFNGIRLLRAAGAPAPYNFIDGAKGIWGDKGLRSLLIQAGNTTTNTAVAHSLMGDKGAEMLNKGYVDSIGNIDIYFSNEVNEDIGSSADSAAGMFSAGAIGCAVPVEGFLGIEMERDASGRSTQYVGVGTWGEVEVKDLFGAYILHDVS